MQASGHQYQGREVDYRLAPRAQIPRRRGHHGSARKNAEGSLLRCSHRFAGLRNRRQQELPGWQNANPDPAHFAHHPGKKSALADRDSFLAHYLREIPRCLRNQQIGAHQEA